MKPRWRQFNTGVMRILWVVCLVFIVVLAVQASPLAYQLSWWTADGGGGTSQGNGYDLSGAIGQADAGTLLGGSYSLAGGFWSAAPSAPIIIKHQVMLPLLLR